MELAGKTIIDAAEAAGRAPKLRRAILSRLGLAKTAEPAAIADQLDRYCASGRTLVCFLWG